jgi:hypothetical protein
MENTNNLKSGDKVILDGEERMIYSIYSETEVSLCLLDYEDVEEDYLTEVTLLELKLNLV